MIADDLLAGHSTRILVVDDDAGIRQALRSLLEVSGYEVSTAADGMEALKEFEENSFHLVITDIVMPEIEGFELIRRIRKLAGAEYLIIAISGGGHRDGSQYLGTASLLGATRTLIKPLQASTFLGCVKELLGEPEG